MPCASYACRAPCATKSSPANSAKGHARALLGAPDDAALRDPRRKSDPRPAQRASNRSARAHRQSQARRRQGKKDKTASTRDLELRLGRKLGTKVEVRDKDGKGELAIKNTPPGTNSTNCSKCCCSGASHLTAPRTGFLKMGDREPASHLAATPYARSARSQIFTAKSPSP